MTPEIATSEMVLADPGLGMNQAPDRLYPAVVVVLCSCRLRARGERRLCASLQDLEKQRQEPARALMARYLFGALTGDRQLRLP